MYMCRYYIYIYIVYMYMYYIMYERKGKENVMGFEREENI